MRYQAEGGPDVSHIQAESGRLTVPVSLVAVFGLELILGEAAATDGPTDAYVERAHQVNMPGLLTEADGEEACAFALTAKSRARIDDRARDLVAIPRTQKRPFTDDELKAFEGYLDGMAAGKSIAETAHAVSIPDRTLKRRIMLMRDYLGAPNEASIVYGSLLHGYIPKASLPDGWTRPRLTSNEDLHLYIAALGFQKPEVANMIGVRPETVHQHRMRGLGKFDAKSTAQAIAYAFKSGYYTTLDAFTQGGR